jgi:LuxR family maltose regulon positive regulatory protein
MNLMDRLYLAFECFRAGMIVGDESAWRSSLDDISELHQLMGGGDWAYNIPECFALQALASLKQGDVSALIAWTRQYEEQAISHSQNRFSRLHERLLATLGRLMMGMPVADEFDALADDAERGCNYLLVCHVRLTQVLLQAYQSGGLEQAAVLLTSTLQWFVPMGVLRPFIDADPNLEPVLEQCIQSGQGADFAREVLTLRQSVVDENSLGPVSAPTGYDDVTIPLPEPLSQRERHVLRLLSEGMSNKLMGERLGITVATVKSHLSNIYGKLDAGNRGRAVARARSLGLLE